MGGKECTRLGCRQAGRCVIAVDFEELPRILDLCLGFCHVGFLGFRGADFPFHLFDQKEAAFQFAPFSIDFVFIIAVDFILSFGGKIEIVRDQINLQIPK